MNTLELVHEEHATMLAIFQALGFLLDEIAKGKAPDHTLLATMLDYILREPEELHHPKEDKYLFVKMAERDERCRPLIERLKAQHQEGHEQSAALAGNFIRFVSKGRDGFPAFESAARRYMAAAEKHIALEEKELLPLARQVLSEEDLVELNKQYQDAGSSPADEFRDLFRIVASRLPEPYGFGHR